MKWMLAAMLAGFLAAGVATAQEPGYAGTDNVKFAWADVLRVDPIYERAPATPVPREICEDVPVERYIDGGNNNAAGAVVGAIIGGVLGSTVGHGHGRDAATAAGAVIGSAVGSGVASGDDGYYSGVQRRCRTVYDGGYDYGRGGDQRRVAYDVQYRYRGDVYVSRLPYDPGDRLRVRVSIEPAE